MVKKFVDLNNLEHVVDKHDKDIAELRKEIGAKIESVYLKENDQPLPATFSLRRSVPTTQIPEIYNPVGDETNQVFAGVYVAEGDNQNPEFRFALEIPRGLTGPQGEQGIQGDRGEKGEKGDIGDPYYNRYVMAFLASEFQPFVPKGTWKPSTNEISPITDPVDTSIIWSLSDEIDTELPIWMSTGYVVKLQDQNPTEPIKIDFTTPIRISGPQGENGKDGQSIEFIYKLTATSLVVPTTPYNDKNLDDYIPSGWQDHPEGITEDMQCEWMCSRKRKSNGSWGEWNEYLDGDTYKPGVPVVFSKWGTQGIDGDGVQYIFTSTDGSAPENPWPADWETNSSYQEKYTEYTPTDLGWVDDAPEATKAKPCVWVSSRKYNGKEQKWDRFTVPRLWSRYGEDGKNGISLTSKFALVENSTSLPSTYWKDEYKTYQPTQLPSVWGMSSRPVGYTPGTDSIWEIKAYIDYQNQLAGEEYGITGDDYGWSDPIIITGVNGSAGESAISPNYKTYVYKQSDSKPAAPTSNDPKNPGDGWSDIPTSEGRWWQCIGSVNGVTELVTEWSEVIPVNGVDGKDGKDGVAQDGKHVEMRFGLGLSAPSVSKTSRNPGSGWSIQPSTPNSSQHLWMIMATIEPDDTLDGEWSDPVRISGEQGPQGATGPAGEPGSPGVNGSDGIPGVSFESQYCLGTVDTASGDWKDDIPTITDVYPYIWMRQGKRVYESSTDKTGTVNWGTPFRLTGLNGANADSISRESQIIYPAGIYNVNTSYKADALAAPYVLDTSDGKFYVMNYVGTWLGTEQNGRTPSQDFTDNGGQYWIQFEMFDAFMAKVGIIANALIGSAVFNGDYMFSQQGIVPSTGAVSSDYQNFNSTDPYNSSNSWWPNICINFNTGEVWTSAGKCNFNPDGSGHLANKNIEWNTSGSLAIKGAIIPEWANATYTTKDNSYVWTLPNSSTFNDINGLKTPKSNLYKVSTIYGQNNYLELPDNVGWDGCEITVMNNGETPLYLGNVVTVGTVDTGDGKLEEINELVKSYDGTKVHFQSSSGYNFGISKYKLLKMVGVKDQNFAPGKLVWIPLSDGLISTYPMQDFTSNFQYWLKAGTNLLGSNSTDTINMYISFPTSAAPVKYKGMYTPGHFPQSGISNQYWYSYTTESLSSNELSTASTYWNENNSDMYLEIYFPAYLNSTAAGASQDLNRKLSKISLVLDNYNVELVDWNNNLRTPADNNPNTTSTNYRYIQIKISEICKYYPTLISFMKAMKIFRQADSGRYYNMETTANQKISGYIANVCAVATYSSTSTQLPTT